MAILRTVASRLGIAHELIVFLWGRRLWWIIPMVVVMLFLGLLIVFAQTSGIAPFIYTLF